MPTVDLAAQRDLVQLAETDRLSDAAAHQRATLAEISIIEQGQSKLDDLHSRVALIEAEIGDISLAMRKLDTEIESVRSRAQRDADRLASGAATPKEMESLQREMESLARRQDTLEEELLELMEQQESVTGSLQAATAELTELSREVDAATVRRDTQWADLDAELSRLELQRSTLRHSLADEVLAIYDRLRSLGKVGAAALVGDQCSGCNMGLDRSSLVEIRSAAPDALVRCPECSTILARNL